MEQILVRKSLTLHCSWYVSSLKGLCGTRDQSKKISLYYKGAGLKLVMPVYFFWGERPIKSTKNLDVLHKIMLFHVRHISKSIHVLHVKYETL